MLDYDLMCKHVQPCFLHYAFCLDSQEVAARSLRHRALVNATIRAKFPPSSTLLLDATARAADALRAAAQAPGRPGTPASAAAADPACAPSAGT